MDGTNRSGSESLDFFSDKRSRENRLRRSVLAIDDTDFLMEMQSARRRSILLMNSDDMQISSNRGHEDGKGWNQVWSHLSPNTIRNILPLNIRSSPTENKQAGNDEGKILQCTMPSLHPGNGCKNEMIATATESNPSDNVRYSAKPFDLGSSNDTGVQGSLQSPSDLKTKSLSKELLRETKSQRERPRWYHRLGAISKREHMQERAYHDTLDERHELNAEMLSKTVPTNNNNREQAHVLHPYFDRRIGSSRDGLDFSRDITLAMRHDSIHALADSVTQIPSMDEFQEDMEDCDDANHSHNRTGYVQILRASADPKTKKCVLDLIA